MVGIGFGELFYSKVVSTKGEGGIACLMSSQACSVLHVIVSMRIESFEEFVEREDTSLFQDIHDFADLKVDDTVGRNFDAIFIPDLFQYFVGVDSHVLVIGHVSA